MSHEAVAWVLNHSDTKGTEKLILVGIASHADKYGRNAWPSIETLARYASVNERNTHRAIASLRDAGHLIVEVQAGGSRKTPSRYAPNLDEIVGVAAWAGGALGPPLLSTGVALEVVRGGAGDTSGVAHAPPEQSFKEQEPPPRAPVDNSQPRLSEKGRAVFEVLMRQAREQSGPVQNRERWEDAVKGRLVAEHATRVEQLAAKYPSAPPDVIAGAVNGEGNTLRFYATATDEPAFALIDPQARAAYEDGA